MSLFSGPLQAAAPLQTIAGQLQSASPTVAPGQVTAPQQAALAAQKSQVQTVWQQFIQAHTMSAIALDPGQYIDNLMQVTQAQWSAADTQLAVRSLGLASQDYNDYLKIQQEQHMQEMKLIVTAAAVAGSIMSGGTLAPELMSSAAIYDSSPGGG